MDVIIDNKRIKYHKKTFENISVDKQKKVIETAVKHFAMYGYDATNINNIASDVGISIGSLYNYFASKEDLFLGVVNEGSLLLEKELSKIDETENILIFFEKILRLSKEFALNYPEFNQIYLNLTTQNLSHLSDKLCNKIEHITAEKYKNLINISKEKGYIRTEMSENEIAFCLDNLVMMLQFSFASNYYLERMRTFLGDNVDIKDDSIIESIVSFAVNSLTKDIG